MTSAKLLPAIFDPLIGLKPWRVALGFGSFISFEFGKRIKQGEFVHGAWHLWIYQCDWQILKSGRAIAHSEMSRAELARSVSQLDGRVLKSVHISDDLLETEFAFDGSIVLRCTAYRDAKEDEEQWMLFTPDRKVLSNVGAALILQQSDQPPVRIPAPAVQ